MSTQMRIQKDYISAGAVDTSEAELRCLGKSGVAAVRRRVAENPGAPADLLLEMASDLDSQVRMAVGMNRSTDSSIIAKLIYDDSVDVRYRLASASYLSVRLLKELTEDANPYVADRAKRTLRLLREKAAPRMSTIFDFLEEDHSLVVGRLEKLLEHQSNFSHDTIFDEVIDAFDSIRRHFNRQHKCCLELIQNSDHTEPLLRNVLEKCTDDQSRIVNALDALLVRQVDEQDLRLALEQLLERVLEHIDFAEKELFQELRKHVPEDEMEQMNTLLKKFAAHTAA